MRGFKKGSKPSKQKLEGGKVSGPGTGTSDDVKAQVAEGSYIMPADSTEQIGDAALGSMGKQVPVNLSNGEFQMPPEQVYAVGVQALDQMKNATHTPAAQQGKGFKPGAQAAGEPELFFADGGQVPGMMENVGQYWSKDNADFEATSPGIIQRGARALNPLTGFGSAVGAMHDAASQGDVTDMGIAAVQAIPVFGAMRAVAPTMKAAAGFAPSAGRTAAAVAGSSGAGVLADEAQANGYANGGPVFSGVDPDELGRGNTPNRGVIPKQPPNFYTDSSGNTGRNMPSASREVVPYKGPGTAVATIPQPQPAAAPAPQAPKADFYTNNSGTTGKGFAPSSSTAVTPAGPLTQQPQPAQPQRPALPPPQAQPTPRPEPDYRARAEATARAKRDTAALQAERAAQDARFAQAGQQQQPQGGQRANLGRPGAGTGLATAAAAIPAAIDTYDVAVDPNSSGLDVATQAAEGVGRTAATLAGTTAGATSGAALGAFGGPAAPLTVPIGAAIGGLVGGAGAYWGAGKAIEKGRELTGTDTQSPIDRVREREAAQPAPQIQQPAPQPAQQVQRPVAQPAPVEQQQAAPADAATQQQPAAPLENNVTRVGNSFSGTNIGPGFTVNGQAQGATNVMPAAQSPQNKAAVEALFARTPELGQGAPQAAGFQPAGATSQATGARYTVVGGEQDPRKSAEFRAASTPYRGAQNGQLTASQISNMRGIVNDQRTDSTSRANNEANNTALLQREAIGQQGANARTAFTEQGQNSRFDQSNQLDRQRLAGDQEVQGFTTRAAARTEKLYEKYETAKPEERAAIAQQIRDLAGKDGSNNLSNNFMKRKVPAYDDKGQIVGEQEEIVDLRSMGQASSPDGQQGTPPPTNHIEALKNNPSLAAQFEAKYGKGAASRYLGGN